MSTPGRYAKLGDEWVLRGWTDAPFALVNWTKGEQRGLGKMDFFVARSCDGRTNFDSRAFRPAHRALLDRLNNVRRRKRAYGGQAVDMEALRRRIEKEKERNRDR